MKLRTYTLRGIFLINLLLTIQSTCSAQLTTEGYLTIGGQIGFSNYFGDLNPLSSYISTDFSKTNLGGLGVTVTRKLSANFHLRASLVWSRIQGDDYSAANPKDERSRYRYIRNASFRNDIFEFGLTGIYDLIGSRGKYYQRVPITPYLFAGIAVFYHSPQSKTPDSLGGKWVDLRSLGTEGQGRPGYGSIYPSFSVAIPFGIGVKYKLTDRIDLGLEVGVRYTFTDYLDDVSGNYADPGDLGSDLARAMSNRTLERSSAFSGGSREGERNRLLGIVGSNTFVGSDGRTYSTFAGYGHKGDKRGQSNTNDVYVVTCAFVNYIINVGLQCPRFK